MKDQTIIYILFFLIAFSSIVIAVLGTALLIAHLQKPDIVLNFIL